jgi:hypothetical protein
VVVSQLEDAMSIILGQLQMIFCRWNCCFIMLLLLLLWASCCLCLGLASLPTVIATWAAVNSLAQSHQHPLFRRQVRRCRPRQISTLPQIFQLSPFTSSA